MRSHAPLPLLTLCLLAACGGMAEEPPPLVEAPVVQRRVPEPPTHVTGAELEARMTAPSDRVRVYNFWATWCQPCIAEMPVLRTFALKHPEVDVVMVNVDHASTQQRRAQPTIHNHGMDVVSQLLLKAADPNVSLKEHVPGWPEQIPVNIVVRPDGTRAALHLEALKGPELEQSVTRAASPNR